MRFQETFQEATWLPIDSYIKSVNGPVNATTTEKVAWARRMGCSIQFDEGKPGVVLLDHNDGRKRLKIGTASGREIAEDAG